MSCAPGSGPGACFCGIWSGMTFLRIVIPLYLFLSMIFSENRYPLFRSAAPLRRYTAEPRHKIAKTTPCKVEWAPARSARAACVRGTRRKMVRRHGPNLISSRSRARVHPVVCSFAPQRQIDAKCCACGDMECGFDTTDQRAAIRRQQSHGEPRMVRGRRYASKTSASVRRRLDLRDIGQSISRSDRENRTGGGHSAQRAAACGELFAATAATVSNQQPPI